MVRSATGEDCQEWARRWVGCCRRVVPHRVGRWRVVLRWEGCCRWPVHHWVRRRRREAHRWGGCCRGEVPRWMVCCRGVVCHWVRCRRGVVQCQEAGWPESRHLWGPWAGSRRCVADRSGLRWLSRADRPARDRCPRYRRSARSTAACRAAPPTPCDRCPADPRCARPDPSSPRAGPARGRWPGLSRRSYRAAPYTECSRPATTARSPRAVRSVASTAAAANPDSRAAAEPGATESPPPAPHSAPPPRSRLSELGRSRKNLHPQTTMLAMVAGWS